ncbi:MAG TPA: PQQ-binding-like beta-propeller repeat protein [Solirubrobacteraceae bacterium]|nr:PQQ-binding-like beta-propeller repeat protein [Solirubrobacteraceae bacterium]
MAAVLALGACGAAAGSRVPARFQSQAGAVAAVPDGNWTRFDFTAQRSGVGPAQTGITSATLPRLGRRTIELDGTVDSSAIQLHGVKVAGLRRDVVVLNTTYGRAIALDPGSGRLLWQFTPHDISSYEGGPQITQATPVADPDDRYVYSLSPDGYAHKLDVTTGRQLWATRVTWDPTREKVDQLNLSGRWLIVTTGGYNGDGPVYQGHVVLIDRQSGRVAHVWNSLCSARRHLIHPPSSCPASDSAIWARAGAVVEPGSHDLLVATGNGPFNDSTDWGDSVLELNPTLRLLGHWTPVNQRQLDQTDGDLGSTAPALLPGGLAVQGGKSGVLWLLSLQRLHPTTGQGGHGLGGALQTIPTPGGSHMLTAPVVWQHGGRAWLFVATDGGTNAYVLGTDRRLHVRWRDPTPGTSPVLAGGLLYVYDEVDGVLKVLNPLKGNVLDSLAAAPGHWNSPIVIGGRIILPVGNGDDQATTGRLFIYHLPGR